MSPISQSALVKINALRKVSAGLLKPAKNPIPNNISKAAQTMLKQQLRWIKWWANKFTKLANEWESESRRLKAGQTSKTIDRRFEQELKLLKGQFAKENAIYRMISNISKTWHDTVMEIIKNIK